VTDPAVAYLIQSLPWTVAGFLAGCLVTLWLWAHPSPVAPRENHMAVPLAKPKRRRFRPTLVHVLGLVVIALTILSALQSWSQARANRTLTQCLVTYANRTADAIDIRSKASAEAQQATVRMWRTVFQQAPTEEGRATARRVFEEYLTKQEAALKTQQANPYPAAPRDVCPEPAKE
jgi:predicted exporter